MNMQKNTKVMEENGKSKGLIEDIIIISIGLFISSFGTALFYEAGMGSGAMATFCDGLHQLLHITYGHANMAANAVFLILLFLCSRKMINVGTILCVFTIGIYVDIGTAVFSVLHLGEASAAVRLLCVFLGTAMMGSGLGLYVAVDRGFGALEGLVKFFCRSTGLSFGTVKIIQDVILIAGGIFLHAAWGPGTLIAAFLTGPVMQASIPYFEKRLAMMRGKAKRKKFTA